MAFLQIKEEGGDGTEIALGLVPQGWSAGKHVGSASGSMGFHFQDGSYRSVSGVRCALGTFLIFLSPLN